MDCFAAMAARNDGMASGGEAMTEWLVAAKQ